MLTQTLRVVSVVVVSVVVVLQQAFDRWQEEEFNPNMQ